MSEPNDFDFSNKDLASLYEDVLVPVIFDTWGRQFLDDFPIWSNRCILDLATGTGILTRLLVDRIGSEGSIVGLDISSEMLAIAQKELGREGSNISFIESPAYPMNLPSNSFDVVVCQQGFQFFPDKSAAANEIHRVLVPNGKVIISTWLPVSECHFFGVICDSLISIDEIELADLLRIPFDFIDRDELISLFQNAGFNSVSVSEKKLPFKIPGGIDHAIEIAYSTPIASKIRSLDDEKQRKFRQEMKERLNILTDDGVTMGQLATNILEAEKQ